MFRLVLKAPIFIFFFFFRFFVKKNKFIFYSAFGYADSTKYVFEEAARRGLDCYYFFDSIPPDDHEFASRFVRTNTLRGEYLICCAAVVYLTHGYGKLPFLSALVPVIQLWHGTPIKKILLDSKFDTLKYSNVVFNKIFLYLYKLRISTYNYVIASGNQCKEIFISAFGKEPQQVLLLGSPRHEIMINKDKQSDRVEAGSKQYLYLPTWRSRQSDFFSSIDTVFSCEFNEFLKVKDCFLKVALHPFDREFVRLRYDSICLSNISFVGAGFDVYAEACEFDVFILDYSSLMFDLSVISDRFIFFAPDRVSYESERELYFSLDYLSKGNCCMSVEDLISAISLYSEGGYIENNVLDSKMVEKYEGSIDGLIKLGVSFSV